MTTRKPFISWLLRGIFAVILLLVAAVLLLPQFIGSDVIKTKLLAAIEKQIGGELSYQTMELRYFPRPAIGLKQIELDIPDRAEGSVAVIRLYPKILPLLTGQVQLSELLLGTPELTLHLASAEPTEAETAPTTPPQETEASPLSFSTLQESLGSILESLAKKTPDLELVIDQGHLTFKRDGQPLGSASGLSLGLQLDAANHRQLVADLELSVTALELQHAPQPVVLENLDTALNLLANGEEFTVTIEQLSLTNPALQLGGHFTISPTAPTFELDLQGSNIDVDAARKVALSLGGDTTPTREIFDYLRGGTVPQIRFHSEGATAGDLGSLDNIVIEGQLVKGTVGISVIDLDLTEVHGDVAIVDGILHGSGLSTRLLHSTGQNGTLKISLQKEPDLFQLDVDLTADLPQAKEILNNVVDNPDFAQIMAKITNLKGTSTGKLKLGNRLSDIKATIDVTDLDLSANYRGLPFPIKLTEGKIAFQAGQAELKGLHGTLGSSTFSKLVGNVDWQKGLHLNLHSGQFGLDVDELYPWLSSLEKVREHLQAVNQLSGQIKLSDLRFNGKTDQSTDWKFAAAGKVVKLGVGTPHFPARIDLTRGTFNLDNKQLAFNNLAAKSLSADLVLNGQLQGSQESLDSVKIAFTGKMGQEAVDWLSDKIELPEDYFIHAPISFKQAELNWQPEASTTFTGEVSIANGPDLTLDIESSPKQLKINQLTLKDQFSDAQIAFSRGNEEFRFQFTGALQHQTWNALFVNQTFDKGRIKGDLKASSPRANRAAATAEGHLLGEDLSFPLPSGKTLAASRMALEGRGSKINIEATDLSWDDFSWDPFKATANFDQDRITIQLDEAKLCDIDTLGVVTIEEDVLDLNLNLRGQGLDVASSYSCLTNGQVRMTGALDFSSRLTSRGDAGELLRNLKGPLKMHFTDGEINQSKHLSSTLAVVNDSEAVEDELPGLEKESFVYSTITMDGKFGEGKLLIEKLFVEGKTLDMLGTGKIDIIEDTIHVEMMVAPFKTANKVTRSIPGVNYLMAGSLVAIPVRVKGDLWDPEVKTMPAGSVGSSLLSLGERIIKSPIKLIETVTPEKKESVD